MQLQTSTRIRISPLAARYRTHLLVLLCALVLLEAGVSGYAGYSYYEYRTLTGNPNVYTVPVSEHGVVRTYHFWSSALHREMRYVAYLPPGYDLRQNSRIRLPVVYLLHGDPGRPEDWVNAGGAAVTMDELVAEHRVRPMILIMPQGSLAQYAPATEYVNSRYGKWATYIWHDLVNQVDGRFRTVRSARGRALAGLSSGGYGAMNVGLRHRNIFGVLGSFSGYFIAPKQDRIFRRQPGLFRPNSPLYYLPQLKGRLPYMYFYSSSYDKLSKGECVAFARKLRERHASFVFHIYPGHHRWNLWRDHLAGFLVYASEHMGRPRR